MLQNNNLFHCNKPPSKDRIVYVRKVVFEAFFCKIWQQILQAAIAGSQT